MYGDAGWYSPKVSLPCTIAETPFPSSSPLPGDQPQIGRYKIAAGFLRMRYRVIPC